MRSIALVVLVSCALACAGETGGETDETGDAGGGGEGGSGPSCCVPALWHAVALSPECGGGWDWTCDGLEERRWESVGSCSGECVLETEGWRGPVPACGWAGPYVIGCASGPAGCEKTVQNRVQECR